MPDTFPIRPDADDQQPLARIIDYYHRTLKETTEGLDYLRSRGITVGEAIDRFRVGYANRTLGLKLPTTDLKAGKEIRARLQQVGLYRKTGREHFNGCVVFPIMAADGSGQIVDVYGRKTSKDLRKGTPLHVFSSNERRGVWNVEALHAGNEIILCAGLFDALTFWNAGYRNVTCTFGPDALTDDHLAAFREFGIRRVLVTAESIAPKLLAAGIDCYHLVLPPGIDANAYALQASDPSQALGAVIRKALWLGKGQPASVPGGQIPQPAAPVAVPAADVPPASVPVATEPRDPKDDEDELDDDQWDESEKADDLDGENEPDQPTSDIPALPPAPILTASPLPPAPQDIEADVSGDEITMHLGHRRYRIRGLSKNLSFDQLKVNILASTDQGLYVDTLDIYIARHRRAFIAQAAIELGVQEETIKKDLGRLLLKLEELQDEQISKAMEPKQPDPTMTAEEKDEALRLLRDPNLLDRIVSDFDLIGEGVSKFRSPDTPRKSSVF